MDSVQVEKLSVRYLQFIYMCVVVKGVNSERDEVRACMSDMVIAIIFINIMPAKIVY